MLRAALLPAALTGGFCSVFAAGVDVVTDALSLPQVMVIAAISGFCGSLFARFALSGRRKD